MNVTYRHLLIVICGFFMSGCQMMTSVNERIPFVHTMHESTGRPVEMICLWESAEGNGLDNLPTRGFAGQILFFDSKADEPVPVKGDIQIYLFDDLGTEEEQSKPIHRYDFEEEVFTAFKTETNLGIAYQLFLPYPKKVNYKTKCSIRVKLNSEEGPPVFSKIGTVLLSGTEPPARAIAKQPESKKVEQAKYENDRAVQPYSPEEASAYFGSASLPKPKNSLTSEKKKLKSVLSQVVYETQQQQVVPSRLPNQNAHPIEAKQPQHESVHPLMLE